MADGRADMYHGAEFYWQDKSKAFSFFTAVPFGLTADEMDAWLHSGGGQELWDELSSGFGIKAFAAGNSGAQMAGWFNKEINTPDDYKGLTMRMPGLAGEVIRRLGATAVTIPGSELFAALQSGTIDAAEWAGPWNDLAFGFYKIAKYYYYPGFQEPGATLSCGVNLNVWNSLTATQQAAVMAAAFAENNRMLADYNANNGGALDVLIDKHGVDCRKLDDRVLQAIGEASGSVMTEVGQNDEITARVFKSFREFRHKILRWTALGETTYTTARGLPFDY